MSEDDRAQCLLFVTADRKPGALRKSSRSLANSFCGGFALFPQSFRNRHPEVDGLFLRNELKVMTGSQDVATLQTLFKNNVFEVFEILFLFKSPDNEGGSSNAPNGLFVLVDDFNREVVQLLLSRDFNISYFAKDNRIGYTTVDNDDNLKVIKRLLSNGKDIAFQHFKGGNILHFAVKRNLKNLVKLLLQSGVDVNAERPDGITPLHLAAKKGLVDIVKILLKRGAVLKAKEPNGGTPFHLAATKVLLEISNTLLEQEPELDAGALDGKVLIDSSTQKGRIEVMKIFLDQGVAGQVDGITPLHMVAMQGLVDIVKTLLEYGADINAKGPDGMTLLHVAASKGLVELVKTLLERGADVNARDIYDATPLNEAASEVLVEISITLLEHEADIDDSGINGIDGETLLHSATKGGLVEVISTLLEHGVDIDAGQRTDLVPLHTVAAEGLVKIVKTLLKYGADINAKGLDDMTLLHTAAKVGLIELVKILLEHEADINAVVEDENYRGYTPLIFAYKQWDEHPEVFELLLESGADVNVQFDDFYRPSILYFSASEPRAEQFIVAKATLLYAAAHNEEHEVIKLILCHQLDVKNECNRRAFLVILLKLQDDCKDVFEQMKNCGFTIDYRRFQHSIRFLCGAIHKNCFEAVEKMLDEGVGVNEVYENTFRQTLTPIHMAAMHAGEDVIQLLLDRGADINKEVKGKTPIYSAVCYCNVNAVKFLVANNADFKDKADLIIQAARTGSAEMMEFLLLNGLAPKVKDEYYDALGFAAFQGHMKIIELLFLHGAHLNSEYVNYKTPLQNAILGGHSETYQAILDHNFADTEFIEVTQVFQNFDGSDFYMAHMRANRRERFKHCSNILARHVIMLQMAGLCTLDHNVTSFWHANESMDDFRNGCKNEVEQMKSTKIGGSELSFYDILTQKSSQLVGYARDIRIVDTMMADSYRLEFPIYSRVLHRQFRKGYLRAKLVEQGIKTCSNLIPQWKNYNLPCELGEKIINYLSYCDLLVLNNIPSTKLWLGRLSILTF